MVVDFFVALPLRPIRQVRSKPKLVIQLQF